MLGVLRPSLKDSSRNHEGVVCMKPSRMPVRNSLAITIGPDRQYFVVALVWAFASLVLSSLAKKLDPLPSLK